MKREQKERHMRTGKIARLPLEIREELNRRIEKGETGVRLVNWLNKLPGVKDALKTHFDGRPINEVNLTEWRSGGYVEWQAQEATLALAREFKANGQKLAALGGNELTECLKNAVAAHYAALLQGWDGVMTDEMRAQLRGLKGLSREVARLRRSDREFEQMKINREALELERQKTEQGIRRKFEEWAADTDFREEITPKMTKEEKDRALYRLIYGREKDSKASKDQAPTSNETEVVEPPSSDYGAPRGRGAEDETADSKSDSEGEKPASDGKKLDSGREN